MRFSHRESPFHKIERWCGGHFRPAELWEVGSYILVKHQQDKAVCASLELNMIYLEEQEKVKDAVEQQRLRTIYENNLQEDNSGGADDPIIPTTATNEDQYTSIDEENATFDDGDEVFEQYLENLHRAGQNCEDPTMENGGAPGSAEDVPENQHAGATNMMENGDDMFDKADEDIAALPQYLGPEKTAREEALEDAWQQDSQHRELPTRDMFYNQYVRVLHTNGVHNMAMVHCLCHGERQPLIDLLFNHLVPASFEQIKTLFTAQVLDYFRLSNLELKASAYHFYQLLRRITAPMAPAQVLDLYAVFRRMTRIWRWTKKLKWAGYGCHGKDVAVMASGELAILCCLSTNRRKRQECVRQLAR